jgi:hypothetical protein
MSADAKPEPSVNIFRKLYVAGYRRLVPVLPCDAQVRESSSLNRKGARGKAVGVRGRDGLWHGYDWVRYECDVDDLDRWHAMGADVGIKGGPMADGHTLGFIDADTKNYLRAALIQKFMDALAAELGLEKGFPKRIGQAPKAAFPVRIAGPVPYPYTRIEFGDRNEKNALTCRVEILTESRYLKVHGIHPDTGEPYAWPVALCRHEDLPIVTAERLDQLLRDLADALPASTELKREGASVVDVDQDSLRGDAAAVARIVAATPNTTEAFPTRESYRDFGYAIKASMPDDEPAAFALFSDWCDRWQDGTNDPEIVASDWRRLKPPFKRGFDYLVREATRASGGAVTRADGYFDAEAAAMQPEDVDFTELASSLVTAPPKTKTLEWVTLTEAAGTALTHSNKPLVKGLLDQGAMTVLYGESNTGKTFVAMDMGYHIATGRPWGGMATTQCPVAYVVAEGGTGARKRAGALCAKYGPTDEFHYLLSPVDLLDPKADLVPLCVSLKAMGPGIVFVDTLSRVMAGGDENSSVDMGALVRHMDLIRQVTGAHLVVVHHTGKDLAKGARGHSLLRAATDTEIEVTEGLIRVTKQRDLDKEWTSPFVLESMVLGVSEAGDVVTSAVVDLTKGVALAPPDRLAAAVDAVRAGDNEGWKRDARSGASWVGVPVGLALGIPTGDSDGRTKIEAIIVALVKEGRLVEEMRVDKNRNRRLYVKAAGSIFD